MSSSRKHSRIKSNLRCDQSASFQSKNYTPLLDDPYWYLAFELGPYNRHRPNRFGLLVNYYTHICDSHSTVFSLKAITDTFVVLAGLHGSPSTPQRQRHYVETTFRFMDLGMIRDARYTALSAAFSVWTVVAAMGREHETLQKEFSRGLTSTVLGLQLTIFPSTNTRSTHLSSARRAGICATWSCFAPRHRSPVGGTSFTRLVNSTTVLESQPHCQPEEVINLAHMLCM